VAIDYASNLATVVNSTDATVTIIPLGSIRSSTARPQPQVVRLSPFKTLTSTSDETLTIIGGGFVAGAAVRINEKPLVTTFVTSRKLTAVLPASQLAGPVRYVVDIQNPDGSVSNVNDFYVMASVSVGLAPRGVAIDRERNLAVVTNSGAAVNGSLGTVSIVDLNTFTQRYKITVGKSPQGVALSSLAGRAAVANTGDDTVSVINLDTGTLATTVSVAPSSTKSSGTSTTGTSQPRGPSRRLLSMRNRLFTLAYGAVLMVGVAGPAVAQDNGAQQPSARQHMHAPQSIDQKFAQLTKDLELTSEQQKQVRPLLQERHDKIQALLDKNPKASRQELAPEIHAISDETHRKIHALLADHQKELEKAMQHREHNGEEDRRSAPPAAASQEPSSSVS